MCCVVCGLSFVVRGSLLFAGCGLLFVLVCCLFVICCVLAVCSLRVACWLMLGVRCVFSVVRCVVFVVYSVLLAVC